MILPHCPPFLPLAARHARLLPLCRAAGALALVCASSAQAASISTFSPQGEVAQARQVVVKFDTDVVRQGDPGQPAPVAIHCDKPEAALGEGHWNNAREWVFNFRQDLPPGLRCQAQVDPAFKPLNGSLTGASHFAFHTGGPSVQGISPGGPVEEDQVFVMKLNGPATAESLQASVWCAPDGLGERVPIRLVDGQVRAAVLQASRNASAAAKEPGRFVTFACNRRLTPGSRVNVVYGKGVRTPSGVPNNIQKSFSFRVRDVFSVDVSCERENAQAACVPIQPVEVKFSAPVPRRLAGQVRLLEGKTEHQPALGDAATANRDALLDSVRFAPPFGENASLSLHLPPGLQDASGRAPVNLDHFPLTIATGPMPPLAKFAAAPFGIVERFAEGPGNTPLLPVTLRRVEASLPARMLEIAQISPDSDAQIIEWFHRVSRYDKFLVPITAARRDTQGRQPIVPVPDAQDFTESRSVALLAGVQASMRQQLPSPEGDGPAQVVGIPVKPGFHVVELSSQRLGQALMGPQHGAQRTMHVRTSVLVTNLGVHFKLGRENALAWVTTLDKGKPVAGATVRVSACNGKLLASATTDAQGLARFSGLPPTPPLCQSEDDAYNDYGNAYFVSARAQNEGVADMAFTWSSWQKGIEAWRFGAYTSLEPQADLRAHTIFDRTLLRAGETLSMKHVLRTEAMNGFALPGAYPGTLAIVHEGSGQEFTQPLRWRTTATGGLSAESQFVLPPSARLGLYRVALRGPWQPPGQGAGGGKDGEDRHPFELESGQFRVEEFRLPVMQGRIGPQDAKPLVAATQVPVQVQLNYLSGGPASGLPVQVSAITRGHALHFADYEDFHFSPPEEHAAPDSAEPASDDDEEDAPPPPGSAQHVVADKLPVTLGRQGLGQAVISGMAASASPRDLLLEASYPDPNGEVQTLRGHATLWPAAVIAGLRAEDWASSGSTVKLQALALDLQGKPQAGVPLQVRALARITTTSRKRMVGGFYAYDNRTHTKDLGVVCSGKSDAQGLLACNARLDEPGRVELIASASDAQGRRAQAAASVWVTRQGELWFGGENHDRMDLLPERKQYKPGETARFQVRMPFRRATALLTVEREGILHTEVVQLQGSDPTVSLKIDPAWGPNVYVSVLALRGRLYDVPWYSFFTWGFKSPREWWRAWRHDSKDYVAPTPLVDLSKPAFRLGMAEIRVDDAHYRLHVDVKADRQSYPVRGVARITVQARLPDGQPAAHAEVALAAVDQALLELKPNTSWQLLQAMLQRRAWGVETATAQMEIIGRRHYGRKAVPAGGDGGGTPTRELLDTLLLWQPRLQLDAQGQAQIEVPLNDALSSFVIAAVADAGPGRFGTGQTTIHTTQDLQIISGLPPLVRTGDQYRAQITLRNTTARDMQVAVTARAAPLALAPQQVDIPAGQARSVHWDVTAPATAGPLPWDISAHDQAAGPDGAARDALKVRQHIAPAVPDAVQQALLLQLPEPGQAYTLAVAPPAGALPGRGGIHMALQPGLAGGLPGIRDWFARYPYTCLEQQTSKAIGMRDAAQWQKTLAAMPAYLDEDGLAYYFPPGSGTSRQGSPVLTAWLLASTHEAAQLNPAFALSGDMRTRMLDGLAAFAEGRIERNHWSPRADTDARKLAAIEALSRYGQARPGMLTSIRQTPEQWPTHSLLDWISILRRVQGIPGQPDKLAQAMQTLRQRLSWQGTRLGFATEADDHWWWLMSSGDLNAARLLLAVMDEPAWQDDMGRLLTGFLHRQRGGAWHTTTANLWGSLAIERFAKTHEAPPLSGHTSARLGNQQARIDWPPTALPPASHNPASAAPAATAQPGQAADTGPHQTMQLPWPPKGAGQLDITHQGTGRPWLTLRTLAAVPLAQPQAAGYRISKTITPLQQADKNLPPGQYSSGDLLRITLQVQADNTMTWVAITDPIPGGATILGGGLGRDSAIATQGERSNTSGLLAYEERSFEAFRSYYEYLPRGQHKLEYTIRLNNPGTFQLPPTRAEALYAPEISGQAPNPAITVR